MRSPKADAAARRRVRTPPSAVIFGVFFGIVFGVLLVPFLVLHRLLANTWRPGTRPIVAQIAACGVIATGVMAFMARHAPSLFFGSVGCLLLLIVGLAWLALHTLRPASSRGGYLLTGLLAIGLPALLVLANCQRPMPLPYLDDRDGNAASSFGSTAPHLARFLIHVMDEARAHPDDLVAMMLVPQVSTGPHSAGDRASASTTRATP